MRHTPYRGSFGHRGPARANPVSAERATLSSWLQNAGKAGMSAVEIDERVESCGHLFTVSWRVLIRQNVMARFCGGRWYWGPENMPDEGSAKLEDCSAEGAEIAGVHNEQD